MSKKSLIKTPQQLDDLRVSGKHLTDLLVLLRDSVKPGMNLLDLEHIAEKYIKEHKLKGPFKGYEGFPANLCLSVNDCVVHGVPDQTILKNGDVLKIDGGISYNNAITDAAITVIVGGDHHNPRAANLIDITKKSLDLGLATIVPGKPLMDFAKTVYSTIIGAGFSVIRNLTGHGVGNDLHEAPHIYNFPHPAMQDTILLPGMCVCLEPITAYTSSSFREKRNHPDNLYTSDGDMGVQREYCVIVTETGTEVIAGLI